MTALQLAFVWTTLTTAMGFFGGIDATWHTVDGGGEMFSSAGSFELSGTVGQTDAGSLIGGAFELFGGFWPATQVCNCPGDMNGDGDKNGADIQKFVNCIMVGGSCACADVDAMNGVTIDDVEDFVADLLSGTACP